MAQPITWTQPADAAILHGRARGDTWPAIALHLRVGRNAVITRARHLGLPSKRNQPQPAPKPQPPRSDRTPFPAGHPVTWGAITVSTPLHGIPYPLPVFL